ncbi:MAG: CBS domain-containing protein [Neisseriaceae bacterium]|nr:CBS domain-containing protein [Neisseriaceae bacterium]
MDENTGKTGFFERIFNKISSDAPENVEEIVQFLKNAAKSGVIDRDTVLLLEKVVAFADLEVRDVMVSRSQMNVLKISDSPKKILDYVLDTAHSRFPVIAGDKDEVLGILHTKDLLRFFNHPEDLDIRQLLREPVFVPESKSLNRLLKEFRDKHIHLAMVIDEYGGVSGLITFEDILEAILGEISDEFDTDEVDNIASIGGGRFRVNAVTEISEFNEFFHTDFAHEDVDTIGGLVISSLERLPERGEKIQLGDWQFAVARVDQRRLYILIVQKIKK